MRGDAKNGVYFDAGDNYNIFKIKEGRYVEISEMNGYFLLCLNTGGDLILSLGERKMALRKAQAVLLMANRPFCIEAASPSAGYYLLFFRPALFKSGVLNLNVRGFLNELGCSQQGRAARFSLEQETFEQISALLKMLIWEHESKLPPYLSVAPNAVSIALAYLLRSDLGDFGVHESIKPPLESFEIIHSCIEYIDKNYMQPLTLASLSRRCMMSKTTFSMLFPQVAGMSFKRYITERRMEEALALAQNERMAFKDIAKAVGYTDFSTFYRNFTKTVGVAPSEYRRTFDDA